MPKSRIILSLGALIALLPLFGFPRSWETVFQVFAGLAIVILSVWATIDKKLMLKHKAQARRQRPVATPETLLEANPDFSKRVTDFYPKTAPPGRRLSDINPTTSDKDQTEI